MKFDFMYGTPCVVTVVDTYDNSWEFGTVFHKVQDAFNVAEDIFNGYTAWDPNTIDVIFITDTNTGEILVECTHDNDTCHYEEDEPCEEVGVSNLGGYDKVADQLIDLWF